MKEKYRFIYGASKIGNDKTTLLKFLILIALEYILLSKIEEYVAGRYTKFLNYSMTDFWNIFFIVIYIVLAFSTLALLSIPEKAGEHKKAFEKIGLLNKNKETPELIANIKIGKNKRKNIYFTNGISLKQVKEYKEKIESALNINVVEIKEGKDKTLFEIISIPGDVKLPDYIEWDDKYLQKEDGVIALGKNLNGIKTLDLSISPHVSCGGQTNSGKSKLLSMALYQLNKQGSVIYLIDFKGGVDYSKAERETYKYVTEKQQALHVLNSIVTELDNRMDSFNRYEVENISEYNKKFPNNPIERIIVASDEVASLFEKRGLTKEEKEVTEKIEKDISKIARLGRAFGIHLWLSTQRADAETIPPQIRSNLTYRVCGRANEILSKLTIDNTLASEIPSDKKGRFVDDTEDVFQAFYFNNKEEVANNE